MNQKQSSNYISCEFIDEYYQSQRKKTYSLQFRWLLNDLLLGKDILLLNPSAFVYVNCETNIDFPYL
jgi:hypothetical protein